MEENKERDMQTDEISVEKRSSVFLRDLVSGACIGVAFIIPGFSGGSVAAILGIYEKLINAIAGIFKETKQSIKTLFPIFIGLILGVAALLFPLEFLIARFPLPTVSVFVGLALGGLPSLVPKLRTGTVKVSSYSFATALIVAAMLSFIPVGSDVDLFNVGFGGYVLLFLVGVVGSSALVVPGISGSMLLLILGYYNPIVNLVTNHLLRFEDVGKCVLVLGACGAGIAVGFLLISLLMKYLLQKHVGATYAAIVGFIIGSIPTVYVSTMKSAGMITQSLEIVSVPNSPLHYGICLFFLIMGACASYYFAVAAGKSAQDEEK